MRNVEVYGVSRGFLSRHFWGGIAVTVFLLVLLLQVHDANAWWDDAWQQRKMVQFDTSAQGAGLKENLTDVPVLIRLHMGNFTFASAKEDGADLRFVASDDKTPLKHHIEKYDPGEEIALIWVKVPRISGESKQDSIWMYYGNESVPDGQDAGGTYDVNQVMVHHFSESEGQPGDATAYKNRAVAFTGKPGLPSIVGNGVQFGGTGERLTIAKAASLNFTKGFTFSAWIRTNGSTGKSRLFSWDDGKQNIVIGLDFMRPFCNLGTGKAQTTVSPQTKFLIANRWHHVAVTVEPGKQITLYLDGAEAGSGALKGTVPAPDTDVFVGASSAGIEAFAGNMDELTLSNTARTGDWIKAAFQSQGPDGLLSSLLEEETGGGSEESLTIRLLKVVARTITLDGWLIIGFLAIMGFASVYVFYQKMVALREASKGNKLFSESFRHIDHPFDLLEKEQDFPGSTLNTVYHAGIEELTHWFKRQGSSFEHGSGLSERAMNCLKASLEKAAMYESRRLFAGMVILNMSVAAGPFLGLLGTVWGVMNTFASLAESGEANITAIAPGVASALACTMAGLLVAIPALFASSYVTGLIRNMNADMNVFIDDFIIKMEERKGDED